MAEEQLKHQTLTYAAEILAAFTIGDAVFAPSPDDVERARAAIEAAGEEGVELFRRRVRVSRGYPADPEDFVPRIK